MTRIVFATGNAHKLHEIREIMKELRMEVTSMREAGVETDAEENGTSFEENARIKAEAVAAALWAKDPEAARQTIVLADDSGLVIDFLNGEPGIYSARYLGADTPHAVKNRALLKRMEGVPVEARTARFVCAVAAVLPDQKDPDMRENGSAQENGTPPWKVLLVRGVMEGRIACESAGENGFGYDPIFFLPAYGKTSAEISPEKKNAISHRGKALRAMAEKLHAEVDKRKNDII